MLKNTCWIAGLLSIALFSHAQPPEQTPVEETVIEIPQAEMETCLRSSIVSADNQMTVQDIKQGCTLLLEKKIASETEEPVIDPDESTKKNEENALNERMTMEALNRANRFMLTPHRRNYILPISYKHDPYPDPYEAADSQLADLRNAEAEFQLSIKILLREGIFNDNGHLYLGYTSHTLWQVYNRDISAPFRETNQEPELILSFTNDWKILGFRNVLNEAIINHQSNGQSGELSRSWNRLMINSVFERDNFVFSLKPWYRLPESGEEYPGDPRGDDNPDIEKYMGHFELSAAFKRNQDIYSIMLRNNLREQNKGAVELGWTFPLSEKAKTLRGYVKFFSGYGQSLIDYDDYSNALGIGVIFTDIL